MYRTDLAIERKEILDENRGNIIETSGVDIEKTDYGRGVKATAITITNAEGEVCMQKPMGKYITIETKGVLEEDDETKENMIKAVSNELNKLIKFHNNLKVMIAGLGNGEVTPDSLGPVTAAKIRITRHLFVMFDADSDDKMSNVSCMIPGVTANTGMETAELVNKAVEVSDPETVIVIDSLAARNIERLSTTIQITDTGISPGAGMGNRRKGINEETIGKKVIAIGVPTVIDASTIIRDALNASMKTAEEIDSYIEKNEQQLIVTSTDIDMLIEEFSNIIAAAVNKTLHPGIYS